MITRPALCCISILFSGLLTLAAQSDPAGGKRAGAARSAWFACLSKPEGLENPVKVLAGEKLISLELPEFMASDAVPIPTEGLMRIVRETPDPTQPGKTKYLILAEAKIPEGVREALVILAPLAKPEGTLLFEAKVQDLASFKGGDRLFINLSDTNIGVQLGDTNIAIPAKQSNIFSAPNLTEPTNMPVIYRFYHPEENKWKMLTASTVVLRPTRREICVFNNGTRVGNIKNHKILFPVQSARP